LHCDAKFGCTALSRLYDDLDIGDLLNAFPANVSMYHHSSSSYRGRRGIMI